MSYPECDWYDVGCEERNDDVFEDDKDITKRMSGFYIGAVNAFINSCSLI